MAGTVSSATSPSAGKVLNLVQLKRLARHKYSSEGQSLLEPYMQYFWRWLVEQIPLWWAPNAITLAGLFINGSTTFLLMMFCSDAKGQAPSWCYYLCACGLFIYQSLDAIDGKQARRTNSSSPLGELFDHGCDALSIVFVITGTCIMLELGSTPWLLFLECFATMFVYYAAHWQTYCSGMLHFGIFDVTEGQLFIILMHILTGLFGTSIWQAEILTTGVQLKMIPASIGIIAGVFACLDYFYVIVMRGGVGKNGSTVAGTSVLSPVFPIGFLIFCAYRFWMNSKTSIFEHHPVLFVMAFGMSASKLSNKLVISYMSCSEMELSDSSFIGPIAVLVNQYFSIIDDYPALWFCFIYCSADLCSYSAKVCVVICDYLNIRCFKIEVPTLITSTSRSSIRDNNSLSFDQNRVHETTRPTRANNVVAHAMTCLSNTAYSNANNYQRN
jgi:choline/ethanolamine phosphotransferase